MTIIFVSVALLSFTITIGSFAVIRKLNQIKNDVATERIVNELLREHITKLETQIENLKEKSFPSESVKAIKPYWKRKKKQEVEEPTPAIKKRGRKRSSGNANVIN